MLGELVDAGLINPYEDAGKPYAAVQNWQSYVRTVKPRHPVPSFGMGHCRMPYGFKTVKVRNAAALFLKHLDIERVSPVVPQGIPSGALGNVGSKGVGELESLGVGEKDEKDKPSCRFPPCPIAQVQEIYHEILPMLPKVRVGNPTRDAHMRARWQQIFNEGHVEDTDEGLQFFRDYFTRVSRSKFLIGQGNPAQGRKPFRADLLWLINQTNFAKVIERGYA